MPPWLRPPDGRTSAGRIVPVVGSLQPISNVQPLHVSSVPLRGAWKANDCIGHVTDDLRLPESCEIPLHLFIGQAAKILAILTAKEKGAVSKQKAQSPADAGYQAINKDVYEIAVITIAIRKPAEPTKSCRKIFHTSTAIFSPKTEKVRTPCQNYTLTVGSPTP